MNESLAVSLRAAQPFLDVLPVLALSQPFTHLSFPFGLNSYLRRKQFQSKTTIDLYLNQSFDEFVNHNQK